MTQPDIRTAFADATRWFERVVGAVPRDAWDRPALGVWTVRDLVGHSARVFLTLERFLGNPADHPEVLDAADYYRRALEGAGVHDDIAQRGRESAEALGADPVQGVSQLVAVVLPEIVVALDDRCGPTAAGAMRLADYLPTRVVELVVHTTDLCDAIGSVAEPPHEATRLTLAVLTSLVEGDQAVDLLRAITGRALLPADFNVLE